MSSPHIIQHYRQHSSSNNTNKQKLNNVTLPSPKYTSNDTNLKESFYGSPLSHRKTSKFGAIKLTHSLLGTFKVNELSRRNITSSRTTTTQYNNKKRKQQNQGSKKKEDRVSKL